jgi:predicted dehydrogenase
MKEDRRTFIRKSAIAAAGVTIGAQHLGAMGTGAKAMSAKSYDRIMGSNDRINIAVAGCYRRASALRGSFGDLKDRINILYVCDVVKDRREKYADSMVEAVGYRPRAINDFREFLADPEVDAFFNLTPDHWHAPGTWMALEAGKHVYVEKPLTHNPREGELLVQFQKKYGRVVQMGNQQRSQKTAQAIIGEIHNGLIGEAYMVLAYYSNQRGSIGNGKVVPLPDGFDWDLFQGPAPREAFKDIYFDYNWHWFWPWGTGETGNNATHELDVARWVLGVAHPEEVSFFGGKFQFIDDDWTMYDTMDATFVYPGNRLIKWDGKSRNNYQTYGNDRGNIVYGTEGSVFINRNGYKQYDLSGKLVKEDNEKSLSVTTGMGGEGAITTNHIANFLDAIQGKAKQDSDLQQSADSTLLCHLSNIASRTGQSLRCNPATGHILDRKIMKQYWGRTYEPGWEPPA